MTTKAALVIGAGVAGLKCSLDLALTGVKVYLCDRQPFMGGLLPALDKWFPDNHCGFCKLLPDFFSSEHTEFCLRHGVLHKNVEFWPLTTVKQLQGEAGAWEVTLEQAPAGVHWDRCIGCGRCEACCPVSLPDLFEQGLGERRAISLPHPFAMPNQYVIDPQHCTRCGSCVSVCPTNAIELEQSPRIQQVMVGAVVVATGSVAVDPAELSAYGYGRYPNVLTSTGFERLLSPAGPYGGRLRCPFDQREPTAIAWLHCVGSRTSTRDYCSAACCMYSLKEALLVRARYPAVQAHLFCMDLRAFGKDHHQYYEKACQDPGIHFHYCRVPQLEQNPANGQLQLTVAEEGQWQQMVFDLAVLAMGRQPDPQAAALHRILGVQDNAWGFLPGELLAPVRTNREGIFSCGSARVPSDIAESVITAAAAAAEVAQWLTPVSPPTVKVSSPNTEPAPVRIAVVLCEGEQQLAKALDLAHLVKCAQAHPHVVNVSRVARLCDPHIMAQLRPSLQAAAVNRLVVAACTIPSYTKLFQDLARQLGIPADMVALVDWRQLMYSHSSPSGSLTSQAHKLLQVALAKLRWQTPLPDKAYTNQQATLIIGGGLAGLTAAWTIASQGLSCHLVEQQERLGGNLPAILRGIAQPCGLLNELVQKVAEHPQITVHLQTTVTACQGHAGAFTLTLHKRDAAPQQVTAGALIVATGGQTPASQAYSFGRHPKVITIHQLEYELQNQTLQPTELDSIVMIHCVDSRDQQRPYCSRICCQKALKNALFLKKAQPQLKIFMFYRDLMSYGFNEAEYTQARAAGVIFVRYTLQAKPQVQVQDEQLIFKGYDPISGYELSIQPDRLVLVTGLSPADNQQLAQLLDIELDPQGFLQARDPKFRPLDLSRPGIYGCGLAHSPGNISETILQAQAAAQQAVILTCRSHLPLPNRRAQVKDKRCSGCQLCIQACPYGARFMSNGKSQVLAHLCQGCGACSAVCPNQATELTGYTNQQMLGMIDAAF